MSKMPLNFGTVLVETMGVYPYTRISKLFTPWSQTKFVITTEGLAVFSNETGWNPLDWDKIKEPDSSNGIFFGGFDIKGTINFSTPISSVVTGKAKEDIDSMPTEFYYKLIEARRIVKMFEKDKDLEVSWKDIALNIWAKDLNCRASIRKEEYIKLICEWRIEQELFSVGSKEQKLALALFRKGILKTDAFKKHGYECKRQIVSVMEGKFKDLDDYTKEIIEETKKELEEGKIPEENGTGNRRRYDPSRFDRLKYYRFFIKDIT